MSPGDNYTKAHMIDAGLRLFNEGRAPILRSLTAGTIATEAGFHRQTFYRHWETQDEYMSDLVAHVFADTDLEEPTDSGLWSGRGAASFEESVRGLARREFDAVDRDPTVMLRMGLVVLGQVSDGPLHEVAMAFYRAAHRRQRSTYVELFESWGRRPCAPHQIEDIVMVLRSQLAGILLQAKATGDSSKGRRMYISTALTLVRDMSEPRPSDPDDGRVISADA